MSLTREPEGKDIERDVDACGAGYHIPNIVELIDHGFVYLFSIGFFSSAPLTKNRNL
jgi:hypothetical protein